MLDSGISVGQLYTAIDRSEKDEKQQQQRLLSISRSLVVVVARLTAAASLSRQPAWYSPTIMARAFLDASRTSSSMILACFSIALLLGVVVFTPVAAQRVQKPFSTTPNAGTVSLLSGRYMLSWNINANRTFVTVRWLVAVGRL